MCAKTVTGAVAMTFPIPVYCMYCTVDSNGSLFSICLCGEFSWLCLYSIPMLSALCLALASPCPIPVPYNLLEESYHKVKLLAVACSCDSSV